MIRSVSSIYWLNMRNFVALKIGLSRRVIINMIRGIIFFLLVSLTAVGQVEFPITLGSKKISSKSFVNDYRKLLESDSIKADNKQKFLSDYIDYQLKLVAAEEAKIANTPGFQDEYQSFRKELASPYLIDNEKTETLVREAYSRLKFEKQIAHILVKVPSNPSAADTLLAYQKINNIRTKLLAGEAFDALAKKFSEDDLSALKGGSLGFVTSLQLQYALENAVYGLEVGGVSPIVRTETGYHLVKVNAIRPNQGKIRLAHILVSIPVNAATNLQVEAKNRIEQVQKYLEKGDDSFELICKNYSEDPYSKGRGGELRRWYYSSDLSEELQNQLFSIQRLGDVTIPIRTNLGWQIFKLLDKKPLLSYEEMAEYIRQKVMTDPERIAMIRRSFMTRVRTENQVVIVEAAKKIALERFAQDRVGDEYYLKMPLVQIGQKSWTVQDFYTFIIAQQKRKLKALGYLPSVPELVYLEEFVDNHTMTVEEQHLETKYPAFQEQMKEFYEGSMFSKIVEREIYEPSLDSLNQQKYFMVHAPEYTLPVRAQAKIVSADTPKTLADALDLVKQAPYLMNKRLPDITFGLGKVEISDGMNKIQQELFLLLAKNRDYIVEISGHQDASESDSLSDARVNVLVKYLMKKGIASTRIIEKMEGSLKPLSKTDRVKNARVSFRFFSQSMEDVVKRFNAVKPMTLVAEEGMYVKGQQPLLDSMPWEVSKKTLEVEGRQVYIEISRIEPERLKRFDESRSSVIRGLQAQLERDWLAALKQKFPVQLDMEELNRLMN